MPAFDSEALRDWRAEDQAGAHALALAQHPATEECPEDECRLCSERDCPYSEPLHYDYEGCPSCMDDPHAIDLPQSPAAYDGLGA